MNTDLKHYLKVYNNWFDHNLCDRVIAGLENTNWQQHEFYQPLTGDYVNLSGDAELDITWDNIPEKQEVMQRIWHSYKKYLDELNFSWFGEWSGFTDVRFNKYSENRKMAEHCDHIHTAFDGSRKGIPTMTSLGILNDEYTGGEFIMWGDTKIELKKGDVVVFPSCFLFPHRVEPVTSGVRYTCVSWAW